MPASSHSKLAWSLRIIIVTVTLATILSDRNFDTLMGKSFAEFGGLDDTREFLGREYLEWCREARGQYRYVFSLTQPVVFVVLGERLVVGAHVNETHLEPCGHCQQHKSYLQVYKLT